MDLALKVFTLSAVDPRIMWRCSSACGALCDRIGLLFRDRARYDLTMLRVSEQMRLAR